MDKRSDHDLLSEFVANASEPAFATLVDRHISLVYSAAFRRLHDSHLAEDVTQAVFVLLARKASSISKRTILSGWLYRTARFVSADVLKTETRRRKREQAANELSSSSSAPSEKWENAAPRLDHALSRLSEKDRAAILLRYFEGKTLHDVAEALDCGEDAARKRVDRALEKLRTHLKEKNSLLPATATELGPGPGVEALLSQATTHPLPPGAAIRATTAALADGFAMGPGLLALVKSALQLMLFTKLKRILPCVALAGMLALLWPEIPESGNGALPTAAEVITRHLAESGSDALQMNRPQNGESMETVGTACMSCHRSDRSMREPLLREVRASGEWHDQGRHLQGTFELKLAGPNHTLETIHIAGLGKFVRGRNERTSWAIDAGGTVRTLPQPEAEQFKRDTDWLLWPGDIEGRSPIHHTETSTVKVAQLDQVKCYLVLDDNDDRTGPIRRVQGAHYFDVKSGLRLASIWDAAGSPAEQTNLFQDYQPFDVIAFPSRITRRRNGLEEIFTVTNVVITDVPPRVFKPPRKP